MARRRPRTFQAWLLGLAGTILTGIVLYYGRVFVIEQMAERQLEHSNAVMKRFQEQQAAQLAAKQSAIQAEARQKTEQDAYDAQVAKAMAESKRRHDEAWNNYYAAPKGCDVWQSQTHMVECVNHKMRARKEFEHKWAAGELDQPGS